METNVRYTLAGTFVLIMMTLIVLAVIWLSSGISAEKYSYYTVFMKESVMGLNKEGSVEFNGVEVGSIDEMMISKDNPELIELRLKIKSSTPVTQGTKAKLGIRALSGTAYILLEDKGTNKQMLTAKKGEDYPVIPTTPSILVRLDKILNQMDDSFQKISRSFDKISSSLGSLLSRETIQSLKRVLQKLGG